ncbi:MAG: DUF1614 domain-containing protein [Thermoplasmatota archaeon]
MNFTEILGTAVPLIMLPVLSFSLLIFYLHKKEFLKKSGFDKPEIGLILVGSFFGLVADVPLIVSNETLLNINLGGALIPIIVCGSLIYKKRLKIWKLLIGISIVSVVAYRITRYEPNLGIVAEFPYFLIPSLLALVISVMLGKFSSDDRYHQIPYTYTFAVLGNLIGADIVRIPQLVEEGIMGSIGGAGAMDLVYLSGLISTLPLIFIYYWSEPFKDHLDLVSRSKELIYQNNFNKSYNLILKAVQNEIDKARRLIENTSSNPFYKADSFSDVEVLKYFNFHPYVIFDFISFKKQKTIDSHDKAQKNYLTGRLLKKGVEKKLNDKVNSLSSRIVAYIIDLIILIIPIILVLFYLFQQGVLGIEIVSGTPTFKGRTILMAILSLSISIQFLYFTLLEWGIGGSLGKLLLGLRVMDDEFKNLSFIQSAARNAGRYADMILFFYIISIALIIHSSEDKRIGDHIAGSRVVKIK